MAEPKALGEGLVEEIDLPQETDRSGRRAQTVVYGRSLTVFVRDTDARPVRGASLYSVEGSRPAEFLGTTDDNGQRVVKDWHGRAVELIARSPVGLGREWVPESAYYARVELQGTLSATGQIVFWSTGEPVPDAQLVAYPLSITELGTLAERDSFLAHPEVVATQSDREGQFLLTGLAPGTAYRLLASTRGGVLEKRVIIRGGDHATVEVVPIFGVVAEFVDQSGALVRRPRVVGGDYGFRAVPIDGFHRMYLGDRISTVAWGLPDLPIDNLRELYLLVPKQPGSGPARLQLAGRIPGYLPHDVIVEVPPLTQASPPTQRIVLTKSSDCTGSIRVGLVDGAPFSTPQLGLDAIIYLDGTGFTLRAGLEFGPDSCARVRDIPSGTYSAVVRWEPPELYESKPFLVSVSPGREVFVQLPAPEAGEVRFEASLPNGSPYRRGLRLFIGPGHPVPTNSDEIASTLQGGSVRFAAPPYQLPIVSPGDYTVFVIEPGVEPEHRTTVFRVEKGRATTVSLRVSY